MLIAFVVLLSVLAITSVISTELFTVGDNQKRLQEFNLATGKVTGSYTGFQSAVVSHDYSPDGSVVAAVDAQNNVFAFDTSTRKQLFPSFKFPFGVSYIAVSVSNSTFVVAAGNVIRQYDLLTSKQITSTELNKAIVLSSVAYSPDGSQFTTTETDGSTVNYWGNIRQFDAKTGNAIRTIEKVCIDGLLGVTYSPDSKYFAVTPASSLDTNIRIYDYSTAKLFKKYSDSAGNHGDMRCVAFSRDSKHISAGGSDRTLRQYEVSTGNMSSKTSSTHGAWIQGCAYNFDDSTIVMSENSDSNLIRLINASSGKESSSININAAGYAVRFRP